MDSLPSLLCLLAAAVLWGATDSLMKQLAAPASGSSLSATLGSILACPAYLACLAANQLGSLLYYCSLSALPLSLAAPVANTAKVLVSVATGHLLGEPAISGRKAAGLLLLLVGVLLQLAA
jgi:drug/metabolite transporter (DMT)-like permease